MKTTMRMHERGRWIDALSSMHIMLQMATHTVHTGSINPGMHHCPVARLNRRDSRVLRLPIARCCEMLLRKCCCEMLSRNAVAKCCCEMLLRNAVRLRNASLQSIAEILFVATKRPASDCVAIAWLRFMKRSHGNRVPIAKLGASRYFIFLVLRRLSTKANVESTATGSRYRC
jgi:hypothetical protein